MTLSALSLPLGDVKAHLKVEHDLDNALITRLTQASIELAGQYVNRDWPPGEYPAAVQQDVLNMVAWFYENRGDTTAGLPPIPFPGLNSYRLLPGL